MSANDSMPGQGRPAMAGGRRPYQAPPPTRALFHGLRVRLQRAGVLFGDPRAAIVSALVGQSDRPLSRVGPLRADAAAAGRTALLSASVLGVRLGQGHELPPAIDPHLAGGLIGILHGGKVPRVGVRRQRGGDTMGRGRGCPPRRASHSDQFGSREKTRRQWIGASVEAHCLRQRWRRPGPSWPHPRNPSDLSRGHRHHARTQLLSLCVGRLL